MTAFQVLAQLPARDGSQLIVAVQGPTAMVLITHDGGCPVELGGLGWQDCRVLADAFDAAYHVLRPSGLK